MRYTADQIKALSDEELNLALGHIQGWITYPTDSVECGGIFHLEPDKSPFGKILRVGLYRPTKDWNVIMKLLMEHEIPFPDTHIALERSEVSPQRRLAEYALEVLARREAERNIGG